MITYELALAIGAAALAFYLIIAFSCKADKKSIAVNSLFIIYLTAVVCITLFPILIDEKVEYAAGFTWYNFIPFKTIAETLSYGINMTAIAQILGNVCLSIPYGLYVMYQTKNRKWWKLLLFALLMTVAIEFSQLVVGLAVDNMYRNVDIDDIILNAAGAYAGYGIYKLFGLDRPFSKAILQRQEQN